MYGDTYDESVDRKSGSRLVFMLLFLCIVVICWGHDMDSRAKEFLDRWEFAGVSILKSGGIQNTNDFPVIIKQVWRSQGEEKKKFRLLQPKERVSQDSCSQCCFYILAMDSSEIGHNYIDDW
ncbi:MAG: hypothetical protein ACNFW9_00045 [Candidatus Kerfeldbacteria bacterium]|jgi:hypothetical protein